MEWNYIYIYIYTQAHAHFLERMGMTLNCVFHAPLLFRPMRVGLSCNHSQRQS